MADEKPKKKVGNKGRKANKALSHWRTMQVFNELKLLKRPMEIKERFSAEWQVTGRTIENYIQKANKYIKADFEMERSEIILQLIHCYKHVYEQSLSSKQFSNSIGALYGISRLTRVSPETDSKR